MCPQLERFHFIIVNYYYYSFKYFIEFHFSRQLLTTECSLSNLNTIASHCNSLLPQPKLHIVPEEWLTVPQELQTNIIMFLSLLFDTLTKLRKNDELKKSNSFVTVLSKETITGRPLRIRRSSDKVGEPL